MKKLVTIFLLFSLVCSNTVVGEILNVPALVQHYLEHFDDGETSLVSFLHEHYTDDVDHHTDGKHERLPFKSHHLVLSHIVIICQPKIGFDLQPQISLSNEKVPIQVVYFSSSHLSKIWQPPKSC